jgi:basic membrane protein A and related proteins
MKNIYAAWIMLLIAVMFITACGPLPSEPDCILPEVFCVGLVTNLDGIKDQSFNQAAWAGLQQAQHDLNANIQYIQTADWKDYAKNISTFAEANYDVIVTVGFDQLNATTAAAQAHEQINFIGVDQPQEESLPNLTGLVFPEDQAGFLAGALAAQMTKSKKIGGVFATDLFTQVWRFGEGYRAGAQYINPEIQVLLNYHNDVSPDKTFTDPEWGAETAVAQIGQGADIICGAGEKTGEGAVVGAVEAGALAIGYDSDQYFTLPEAQKGLLSSVIKVITSSVFGLIKAAQQNKFPGGNLVGQVSYAPYHKLSDQVSAVIKTKMAEISRALADGSLLTNVPAVKP